MVERDRRLAGRSGDGDGEEAAFDAVKLVEFGIEAWRAAGVLVAGRAAGELVQAAGRIDGVVLPVAVAAGGEEVRQALLLGPSAEGGAFVAERLVGEIVFLVVAVGSDD